MTDANRTQVEYEAESTWGTTPGSASQILRLTSESFVTETNTTQSAELRSDRQIADIIRTGLNATGEIQGEFSYSTYDDFIASALFHATTWDTAQEVVSTGDVDITGGNTFTKQSGAWTNDPVVGDVVLISGFTNSDSNGYFLVTSVSGSNEFTVERTVTNEAGQTDIEIDTLASVQNGTTQTQYSIQKHFQDLTTDEFELFQGMTVSQWGLDTTADGIITTSFGFLGKSSSVSDTTSLGSSPTPATTNDVMNAVDDVTTVLENGTALDVTAFNFTVNNNLRARQQVGTLGAVSIGSGTMTVEGSFSAYATTGNGVVLERYLNFTETSLMFHFYDGTNRYLMFLPAVKLTSGQRLAGGVNTDSMIEINFSAKLESVSGLTMVVAKA